MAPTRFATSFLAPVAAILAASILSLLAAVSWLVVSQNQMGARREQQVVGASVRSQVDFLRELNRDYSVWNDAFEHVVQRSDWTWLSTQIGDYLFAQRGIEHTFLLGPDGKALYARSRGQREAPNQIGDLGRGLSKAFHDISTKPRWQDLQIGGITEHENSPAIFSISRVRPDKDAKHSGHGPIRYLVIMKQLDSRDAQKLAEAAQLLRLRVGPARPDGDGVYPLLAYDGTTAGALTWTPQRPGSALIGTLAPVLAGLVAALLFLGGVVLRHARLGILSLEISQAKATHMANRDALTGLPNRRAFITHLTQISAAGRTYAIVYMDLDGFKEINDTFGHGAGDALLRRTSERLQHICPPDSKLARLGGDEFAIVLPRACTTHELDAVAERIVFAVRQQHDFGGHSIVMGVSIGIALSDGLEFEDVLRRADAAMYSAKGHGRDGWCIYDASLDDGRDERRALETDLRAAIGTDAIFLVFQPIVRAGDKAVSTVEALVRWDHPERGAISPDIFIPVAEETGLIRDLGLIVLRQACQAARDWPFKLAVNLSPAQFWDRGLVGNVLAILRETGFPAERLEFEITETYLLRRPDAAARVIEDLQQLGIRVALDDFGTGYASIGYLRRFKLDFVKLDRSFVDGIAQSAEAQDVASAIIALSKALKLPIVAEGVECAADADILTEAGCHFLQGWLYGRPMPAAAIDRQLLETGRQVA